LIDAIGQTFKFQKLTAVYRIRSSYTGASSVPPQIYFLDVRHRECRARFSCLLPQHIH
jgi:hypothetical protein